MRAALAVAGARRAARVPRQLATRAAGWSHCSCQLQTRGHWRNNNALSTGATLRFTTDTTERYVNPTPVAVVLVPVIAAAASATDSDVAARTMSLLAIRRNIANEASQGKVALPGGYVDMGESWQEAGAREVLEETRLEVQASRISLLDAVSTPDRSHILLFGLAPPVAEADLPPFSANAEVSERQLPRAPHTRWGGGAAHARARTHHRHFEDTCTCVAKPGS